MKTLKVQELAPVASRRRAGGNVHRCHRSPELAFTAMMTSGVASTLITALKYCANHCSQWEQVGATAFTGKAKVRWRQGAQIPVWVKLAIYFL